MVVDEGLVGRLLAEVFKWITPEEVAHDAMRRGFPEAVDLSASQEVISSGFKRGEHIAWLRRTARKSSRVTRSGDRPPWTQRNCLLRTAARGRLQNDSIQAL